MYVPSPNDSTIRSFNEPEKSPCHASGKERVVSFDLSGKHQSLPMNSLDPLPEPVESLEGFSPDSPVVVIPEAAICVVCISTGGVSVVEYPISPSYLLHSISFLLCSLFLSTSSHSSMVHTPMEVELHLAQ